MSSYVIFGGTGRTGQAVVEQLLAAGHSVKLCARTPSKVKLTHERLTVVKVDVKDGAAVQAAVNGATAVLSFVGGPLGNPSYKGGMLLPFIQAACKGMRAHGVKKLLVQLGCATYAEGEPFNLFKFLFFGFICGKLLHQHVVHQENTDTLRYLEAQCDDLEWIATRPTGLLPGPPDGRRKVVGFDTVPWPLFMQYVDLASYSVSLLEDPKAVKTSKMCGYPCPSVINPSNQCGYYLAALVVGIAAGAYVYL